MITLFMHTSDVNTHLLFNCPPMTHIYVYTDTRLSFLAEFDDMKLYCSLGGLNCHATLCETYTETRNPHFSNNSELSV